MNLIIKGNFKYLLVFVLKNFILYCFNMMLVYVVFVFEYCSYRKNILSMELYCF